MSSETVEIPAAWVRDPAINAADLGTLLRVIDHIETTGGSLLTAEQISIGNGAAMTRTALAHLVESGYLTRSRRLRRGIRYTVKPSEGKLHVGDEP